MYAQCTFDPKTNSQCDQKILLMWPKMNISKWFLQEISKQNPKLQDGNDLKRWVRLRMTWPACTIYLWSKADSQSDQRILLVWPKMGFMHKNFPPPPPPHSAFYQITLSENRCGRNAVISMNIFWAICISRYIFVAT